MILKDRQKLAKLMVLEGITHRELATVAGYKAHSYVSRLLRGDERCLTADAAQRIADRLGVRLDDLFLPGVSSNTGRVVQGTGVMG